MRTWEGSRLARPSTRSSAGSSCVAEEDDEAPSSARDLALPLAAAAAGLDALGEDDEMSQGDEEGPTVEAVEVRRVEREAEEEGAGGTRGFHERECGLARSWPR